MTLNQEFIEQKMPAQYNSTINKIDQHNGYIKNLTISDMSQLITAFPFIYKIYKKNTKENQWKLLDVLRKAPSQSDQPGFIYGFMNEQENTLLQAPYWIKIGRTKQNPPQKRIFQWQKDDQLQITQIFTVRSLYNKKLEKLVHILFDFAHKDRIINNKRRTEWFYFQQLTMTAAAVNILNHLMNTIHTSFWSDQKVVYLNRKLQQITDKITQSNKQIQDIIKNSETNEIVKSIVGDIGIQMRNNDELKLKLEKADKISQMLQIVKEFDSGKNLQICFSQIQISKNIWGEYFSKLVQLENKMIKQLKSVYQNTKVNFVDFSKPPEQKQIKNISPKQKNQHQSSAKTEIQIQQKIGQNITSKIEDPLLDSKTKQKGIVEKKALTQKSFSKTQTVQINPGINTILQQPALKQPSKPKQIKMENQIESPNAFTKNQPILNTKIKQKSQNLSIDKTLKKNNRKKQSSKIISNVNIKSKQKLEIQTKQILEKCSKIEQSKLKFEQDFSLDETKTQEQIRQQNLRIQDFTDVSTQSLAHLIAVATSNSKGKTYMVKSDQFAIDAHVLKLENNFTIFTKTLKITEQLQILKGKKQFKGTLTIMCLELEAFEIFPIYDCSKYVNICKVHDNWLEDLNVHQPKSLKNQKIFSQMYHPIGKVLFELFPPC